MCGVTQSATLVIAYLMRKNKMGFREAIGLVKTKRAGVCPNLGF
jgi:protein-tyrosine phosphatase